MKLLVDIGNTRVKWACAQDNVLFGHDAVAYTRDTLARLLPAHWRALTPPAEVYVASVADAATTAVLCDYVRATWGLETQQAAAEQERAGLRNAYEDVAAMGVDRWLAMLAAWRKQRQAVCVIDCGTALTIDVVLADGQHAGGFILPGLVLTATALAREAHGIPEYQQQALHADFGRTTAACINNGFAGALVGLLQYCAGKVKAEQGAELLFIITGGGAQQLLPLLPEPTLHEPHLVLEGLLEFCGHNNNNGKINS